LSKKTTLFLHATALVRHKGQTGYLFKSGIHYLLWSCSFIERQTLDAAQASGWSSWQTTQSLVETVVKWITRKVKLSSEVETAAPSPDGAQYVH
jgi:hypothetical protein